jgi:hypothetical protein
MAEPVAIRLAVRSGAAHAHPDGSDSEPLRNQTLKRREAVANQFLPPLDSACPATTGVI